MSSRSIFSKIVIYSSFFLCAFQISKLYPAWDHILHMELDEKRVEEEYKKIAQKEAEERKRAEEKKKREEERRRGAESKTGRSC